MPSLIATSETKTFLLSLVLVGALASCSDKSLCPFPNSTAVTSNPSTPCVEASVTSCIDPTLVLKNGCDRPLYVPVEYGRFDGDASQLGADIEVLKGQTVHFVVRPEKATSQTAARKDFTIPARLTLDKLTLKFATLAE